LGRTSGRSVDEIPRWRRDRSSPRRPRVFRPTFAVLGYLAFCGFLVWVVLWLWPPRPASLVLIGAGYETNLSVPHNAYGRAGLRALEAITREPPDAPLWRSRKVRLATEPRTLRGRSDWSKGIDSLPEKTVVLVFALHGAVDAQGAYLLADDADPFAVAAAGERTGRLRVSEVLQRLRKMPATQSKLLIFDATQIDAHWPLGLLHNEFENALEQMDKDVAGIPNLVVISSSAVGQRSWVAPEWGQTVFGHFLAEGLSAREIDRNLGSKSAANSQGRVDADSLYRYLVEHVDVWARTHRGARQTPVRLPLGAEGTRRAARMELTVLHKDKAPAHDVSRRKASLSTELRQAWQTFGKLSARTPSPAAETPLLWNRYVSALLRYDELERAGDRSVDKRLLVALAELERELSAKKELTPGSMTNSLAMPAVEGGGAGQIPEIAVQQFNELWDAPIDQIPTRWEELLKGPGAPSPASVGLLRIHFLDQAFSRAAEDPIENLERAYAVIRAVEDGSRPRPVETQELALLRRPGDLPGGNGINPLAAPIVGEGMRQRRVAERCALGVVDGGHSYSEHVAPWIREALDQGDRERRLGFDLLFASDPVRWSQAHQRFGLAEVHYRRAAEQATVIQRALRLRDEILPVLPYYSQWIARRGEQPAVSKLPGGLTRIALVESLWEQSHDLLSTLESPDARRIAQAPEPTGEDRNPMSLSQRVDRLRTDFDALKLEFALACQQTSRGGVADRWSSRDDLLRVPFDEVRTPDGNTVTRIALIESLLQDGDPAPEKPPVVEPVVDRVRREGSLAIATLGRRWLDETRDPEDVDFAKAKNWPKDFDLKKPSGTLGLAEHRIARALAERPRTIVSLVEAPKAPSDPEKLLQSSQRADRLLRLLDNAGAERVSRYLLPSHYERALTPSVGRENLETHRRLRIQNLLLSQARRALDDHLFGERPEDPRPYYARAGRLYLEDAAQLDPGHWVKDDALVAAQNTLDRPDGLVLEGPQRQVVTSEQLIDVGYLVRPQAQAPPRAGFPVFWQETGEGLGSVSPPSGDRFVLDMGPGADPKIPFRLTNGAIEADLPVREPKVSPSSLRVHGLFRGQRIDFSTRMDVFLAPQTMIARHPVAPVGSIAVRADDSVLRKFGGSNGAVAIVLDASGSMGPPKGQSFSDSTKYGIAVRALERVLAQIPAGTTVALYLFGADEGRDVPPESAIRTIQPPIRWSPDDAAQRGQLIGAVKYPKVEPWNESPIVRTMIRARDDLVSLRDAGFKTIVVLTDGIDNRFDLDRTLNKDRKPLPAFLRDAFLGTGVQVNIVGFQLESEKLKTSLDAQFGVIAQFDVPGRIYNADNLDDLIRALRDGFKQELTYRIVAEDFSPIPKISGHEITVSEVGTNNRWFPVPLPPGGYKIVVQTPRKQYASVALNAGDRLLVNVSLRGEDELDFSRILYSRERYAFQPTDVNRDGSWRLSGIQNGRGEQQSIRMMLAMEKTFHTSETTLRQTYPRELWLEVSSGTDDPGTAGLKWSNVDGLPAPLLGVLLPEWPRVGRSTTPAKPVVRAWWSPDRLTIEPRVIIRDVDFTLDSERPQPISVETPEGRIEVESVRIEDHKVETQNGRREMKPCVVIRIAHPKDRPFFARPVGINAAGYEHRFYRSENKYAGLFWTETRDEAFRALEKFELVSVSAFKSSAAQRGESIQLLLGTPDAEILLPPALDPPQ
jgi:hypothetical protein